MDTKVGLQIYIAGDWQGVANVDESRCSSVCEALNHLDRAAGRGAIRWSLLYVNGLRVLLTFADPPPLGLGE